MPGFPLVIMLIQSVPVQSPARPESLQVVVPNASYQAGALHRFLFGNTRRELWATPIRVPVLDLSSFAGGLRATERGGSAQTKSLRFESADGRQFSFRGLDKDPSQHWSLALRKSPAGWLAQDQISGMFPTGALVVGRLEDAAGLLCIERHLVILPDDERLGKWRDDFKHNVGILEGRPRNTREELRELPGAVELIASDSLFVRLRAADADPFDQRQFLKARLLDFVVGDWDRHEDQWTWVRVVRGGQKVWQPLPRDRDWAFSKLDGAAYSLIRIAEPNWMVFGPSYGNLRGLLMHSEPLDRRLLNGLDRRTWDSVTAELAHTLSDAVIGRAVSELPSQLRETGGTDLRAALLGRRDALPEISRRFYEYLAGTVEVRGSDASEQVRVIRGSDGSVTMTIADGRTRAPRFERRFDPAETREVRLHLFGGADTVRLAGPASPIQLRLIPGGGRNYVADSSASSRAQVYDDSASTTVIGLDHPERPHYTPPVDPDDPTKIFRDWGRKFGIVPWFELHSQIGAVVGGGPVFVRYGFRRVPYQSRIALRVATATSEPGFNADLTGDFRFENQNRRFRVRLATLGVDVVRFFGFGNDTPRSGPIEFYQGVQSRQIIEPVFEVFGRRFTLGIGPVFRHSSSDFDRTTLLTQTRPYGSGSFTEAGAAATLAFDSRDEEANPTKGVRLEVGGRLIPSLFDVESTFGSVNAVGSTYLTAAGVPGQPTLALRLGAIRVFGDYPFFEAAAIGGRRSVRNLNGERFVGDGAVFGSAELRIDLASFTGIAPRRVGLYGLWDRGRVYLDGETSNSWHGGLGGGLWFALLDPRSTVTVTYARSSEGGRFYIRGGFHY